MLSAPLREVGDVYCLLGLQVHVENCCKLLNKQRVYSHMHVVINIIMGGLQLVVPHVSQCGTTKSWLWLSSWLEEYEEEWLV